MTLLISLCCNSLSLSIVESSFAHDFFFQSLTGTIKIEMINTSWILQMMSSLTPPMIIYRVNPCWQNIIFRRFLFLLFKTYGCRRYSVFSSLFQVFERRQLLVQNPKMRFKFIFVAIKIGLLINLLSLCTRSLYQAFNEGKLYFTNMKGYLFFRTSQLTFSKILNSSLSYVFLALQGP